MKETKLLLTINLEGKLSHEKEHVVLPYVKHDYAGKKIIKTGYFTHTLRKPNKCVQKMKFSQETYLDMISNDCPSFYKAKHNNNKQWHTLSKNEKVAQHCMRFADGNTFTFEILD